MESFQLSDLKLMARGGEADIYDLTNGKILRVRRRTKGRTFEEEKALLGHLLSSGIRVPAIYENLSIEGKPAQVIQKIYGRTMSERIQRSPFSLLKEAELLARIHINLLQIKPQSNMTSLEEMFTYFVNSAVIPKELLNFIEKIFYELSPGQSVCHGDFHPGNILVEENARYIIDWSGAYSGNSLSDIAHTYLLLRRAPLMPGQSRIQHAVVRAIASCLATLYLKNISKLISLDFSEFSKWTVVMSFLRVCHGIPTEKEERLRYLQKCYRCSQRNIHPEHWTQYI